MVTQERGGMRRKDKFWSLQKESAIQEETGGSIDLKLAGGDETGRIQTLQEEPKSLKV